MSFLTVTSLLLIVLGGCTRLGWARALGLAGATPAGAALIVGGGIAVPTFAFVALAAVTAFILGELAAARRTGRPLPRTPGFLALAMFFCWVVALTLFAPILFDGFAVTGPAVGEIHVLDSASQPATSNIAQTAYLALGLGTVALVSRDRAAAISGAGLMLGTATLLSSWALLHRDFGVPFPQGVFDNSPSFQYISTAAGGLERFRGIFSEPAGLASLSLATVAFYLALQAGLAGWRRVGALVLVALALWNISVSTATTAIVSGLALGALALVSLAYGIVIRRRRIAGWFVAGVVVCGVVLVPLLPAIADGVAGAINDKVGSSSYDDRSFADAFSYDLTLRTFGLGVGLGSNRPSSLLAGLLSTTGIVGVALFLGTILFYLWRGRDDRAVAPVWWALSSFMITRIISSPDLGDPTGLTWLGMGALAGSIAHASLRARSAGGQPAERERPAAATNPRVTRFSG